MFFLSAEEDNLTELVSKATHPNVGLVHQVNTVQLLILVFPPSLSLSLTLFIQLPYVSPNSMETFADFLDKVKD